MLYLLSPAKSLDYDSPLPDDLPATLRQALEGNVHTAIGGEETDRASAKALGLTERELTILGALARTRPRATRRATRPRRGPRSSPSAAL